MTTAIQGDPLRIKQRIKDELRKKRAVDDTLVSNAIVSAVEHYRNFPFFFNTGTFAVDLVVDQFEYGVETTPGARDGYPADLIRLHTLRLGNSPYELKMMPKPIGFVRDHRFSTTYTGYPIYYAFHGEKLHLVPAPSQAGLTLEADYVKDVGTPIAVLTGSTWTFTNEDGNAWASDQDSPWYGEAEELIRLRAKKDLFANVLLDYEAATVTEALERAAFKRLKKRSRGLALRTPPTPWS